MPNIYYWEQLAFSKLVGKVNFTEKKFEQIDEQKVQSIFGETFILASLSSAAFRLQKRVSDFF